MVLFFASLHSRSFVSRSGSKDKITHWSPSLLSKKLTCIIFILRQQQMVSVKKLDKRAHKELKRETR